MARVIGVDPSLTATGIAWPNGDTWTAASRHIEGDDRLNHLYASIKGVLNGHEQTMQPIDLAVVEDLPTHAHGAGKTGMAQGVVRLALVMTGTPYLIVPAATVKKFATGKGNATKPTMRIELYKRTGLDIADDNQVDAWWLRALGHHLLGDPLLDLPKTHTEKLAAIELPAGVL